MTKARHKRPHIIYDYSHEVSKGGKCKEIKQIDGYLGLGGEGDEETLWSDENIPELLS